MVIVKSMTGEEIDAEKSMDAIDEEFTISFHPSVPNAKVFMKNHNALQFVQLIVAYQTKKL